MWLQLLRSLEGWPSLPPEVWKPVISEAEQVDPRELTSNSKLYRVVSQLIGGQRRREERRQERARLQLK